MEVAGADTVAEEAEEVATTTSQQEADRTTMLQLRTAIPSSHLNTKPSRMLLSTRSIHLLSIPSLGRVAILNNISNGLIRGNRNTHSIPANPPWPLRTTIPTTLNTSTSSNLPTVSSSPSSRSLPMAPLLSNHMDSRTLLRTSQVVLRSSGVPQLLPTLLRTSLTSSLAAPEVEEDTTARLPKPSRWALLSGWVLTTARRGILVLQ